MLVKKVRDVQNAAYCIYSRKQVEDSIKRVAQEMIPLLAEENPIFLFTLMGGMLVCSQLILALDFPLELGYVHVSSFDLASNCSGDLVWHIKPNVDVRGRTVVIVDDILDSGITLQKIRIFCEQKEAKKVYSMVMLDKQVKRKSGGLPKADFTALTVGDEFVFGYGLDYSGYLRNLPGIYGVKGI